MKPVLVVEDRIGMRDLRPKHPRFEGPILAFCCGTLVCFAMIACYVFGRLLLGT